MKNRPEFATFGPGGNSEAFYASGQKSTKQAPAWLNSIGLDAYEYEAGNGITAGETALREIGEAAASHGILMSLHTPYFISLSGVDPEKRLKSIDYIEKSLWAAELIGADTIVIHCGSAGKISRQEAMYLSADTLFKVLDKLGNTDISFGIETMGKQNQLGTLDEVIELCKADARLSPVVDFGHLNARDCGGVFVTADDYRRVLTRLHFHWEMTKRNTCIVTFQKSNGPIKAKSVISLLPTKPMVLTLNRLWKLSQEKIFARE